jgi:hypothetical protein
MLSEDMESNDIPNIAIECNGMAMNCKMNNEEGSKVIEVEWMTEERIAGERMVWCGLGRNGM